MNITARSKNDTGHTPRRRPVAGVIAVVGVLVGATVTVGASVANATGVRLPVTMPYQGTYGGGNTDTSTNWSGLVTTAPSFTGISGSWIVPTLQPTNSQTFVASWVGLDGYGTSSVLQTGTTSYTTDYGSQINYEWVELYPNQPTSVVVGATNPGDHMTGSVTETSPGQWTVTIADVTTGQSSSTPYTYTLPSNPSAEWIVEDPGLPPQPFAAFGSVPFTSMTLNGSPADTSVLTPLNLAQNGVTLATPTNYSDPAAHSFTDVYTGPQLPPPTTTTTTTTVPPSAPTPAPAPAPPTGCDGTIPAGRTVGMATTADGAGYWIVSDLGQVVACGDAVNLGGTTGLTLNRPIVGVAADALTGGYWLVASDGGVFSFGAPFYGSTGGIVLNKPIVGASAASTGYRFVASDGGVFAFGAPFYGSAVGP